MKPSRLIVFLAALFGVTIPSIASHAGVLGPEIIVSNLDNEQFRPDVAFANGPDEYLVVWENKWGGDYRDIYAQRLAADGALLSWYSVASLTNNCTDPSVAYDPTRDRYLVVWAYDANGDGSNWDVRGRFIPRVGPDPVLTDFSIDADSSHQRSPKVEYALVQDEFMVVWYNAYTLPNASDISARRVNADGSGFPGARFWISTGTDHRTEPEIAYNLTSNEYLVAFSEYVGGASDSYEIYAARLTPGGTILGSGEFPVATSLGDHLKTPAVAACPGLDSYLVAWQREKPNLDIYAGFVRGDGVVDGPPIVIDDFIDGRARPDVACALDGTYYLVTWHASDVLNRVFVRARAVMANHVAETMLEVVPEKLPLVNVNVSAVPAVAGGLGGFMISWEQDRNPILYRRDIHARRVSPVAFHDGFESGDTSAWLATKP